MYVSGFHGPVSKTEHTVAINISLAECVSALKPRLFI